MNTDQGSQFTGSAWITTLTDAGVAISMDGRGRYMDNIFIERLWRSLKYEAVYLHELTDGFRAKQVIRDWIVRHGRSDQWRSHGSLYNTERSHSALGDQTPAEAYGAGLPVDMMDKADALPTSPQTQQRQKNLITRILAA
jgi:putative transposase